jgi:hypothetical protein
MWELVNWFDVPAMDELERILAERLAELEKEARDSGWELPSGTEA